MIDGETALRRLQNIHEYVSREYYRPSDALDIRPPQQELDRWLTVLKTILDMCEGRSDR